MLYVTEGLCWLEVAGLPFVIVQLQDVGVLVELSVSVTACPAQTVVAEAVKLATGGTLVEQPMNVLNAFVLP